jgi:branched-chain amino acid transport system substrate-binding protein
MGRRVRLASFITIGLIAVSSCAPLARTHANVAVSRSTCSALEYGGKGQPDALIVSDHPMRGASAQRSAQQVEAIRLELDRRGWSAGGVKIAFQVCDDTNHKTGLWDKDICVANAEAYASDIALLGVIGTYNSSCAAFELPILNRAGVAMISPGNTSVCLTEATKLCTDYSPKTLYPTGKRNYVRVIPNDAYQGAGLATFAQQRGVRKPFILYTADDTTSIGQALDFRGAAKQLGLQVAGFESWDPAAPSYTALYRRVKSSGADAVLLAGLIEHNGAQIIRDKVAVLGPNDRVQLFAYDGFTQQSTIDEARAAAFGMFADVPGRSNEQLAGPGQTFLRQLEARLSGQTIEAFAPYAGEAAQVLLDAIADAGADRAGVVKAMFAAKRDGILGAYRFEPSGDPSAGPVTMFRATATFKEVALVTPALETVAAARTGG